MTGLGTLDIIVLAAYFLAILAAGLWFGRGETSSRDFFLGGRRQHWFTVGVSTIATEVSALTFLVVPGRSYESNCWYLQMYVGSIIGRLMVLRFVLPAFYRGAVTTVYEYLGQRFGPWTRTTATLMFFASRLVGSGIRLLAASLAISVVFGWPLAPVVLTAGGIAVVYSAMGGIKAIIWTDAVQAVVFLGGAAAAVIFLFLHIPGSWTENLSVAADAGKLDVFVWDWHPNNDTAFWVLVISATFQNMAVFGADQDMTQRLLTCPDVGRARRSLVFNMIAGLPVVCVFLLIGVLIFVYNRASGAMPVGGGTGPDSVFADFIARVIPSGVGLKGLLIAGIFAAAMSSLDSALGALSSCAVTDIVQPFTAWWRKRRGVDRPGSASAARSASHDDRRDLRLARLSTVAFGIILVGIALAFSDSRRLLEDAFGWVGLLFGGMLGAFLVGVTTRRRGRDAAVAVAMISSVVILVAIKWQQERHNTVYIAWPWWVVIGAGWTYLIGMCFRRPMSRANRLREA